MNRSVPRMMVCLLCAVAVSAATALDQPEGRKQKEEAARPDKKKTGFIFHRSAAKKTPEAQWTHIEELLAAGKTNKAARAADMLVRCWHESPEAPKAQLLYARTLEQREDYSNAFDEYQYLVAWFAGSFNHSEVLDRQFRIANHVLNSKRLWVFDASEYALPLFEQIIKNAENWERAPEVQFTIAQIHQKLGHEPECISAYELIQTRYPKSDYAASATFLRANALYDIAARYPRDEVACKDAMAALAMSIRDYPRHEQAKDAQKRLDELKDVLARNYYDRALYYDNIMRKPESALIAYTDLVRTFPMSDQAKLAQDRIDELNKIVDKEKK